MKLSTIMFHIPVRTLRQLAGLPRQALLPMLAGLLLAVLSLLGFAAIVEDVLDQESQHWDQAVFEALHHFESPLLDGVMFGITETGSFLSVALLATAMIIWLYFIRRDLRAIVLLILATLGGGVLNVLLKLIFQRTRPHIDPGIDAIGFSLPSGHAMGAMVFYGFMGYLVIRSQRRKSTKMLLTGLLCVFILAIGISRIYLNAHYFTDVVAGYAAGTFWLVACIFALELRPWYRRYLKKTDPGHELPSPEIPVE
ncbi:MAG: phosphatase PAP2 family protein [Candidatus Sericytochromatia bacterium]